MSYSRLEKFIYAICSMDVSDLPVPLSRIEKLWNCLITGETPDFEPLSRNEKYLMAMLDRYDISNLPAPISRGEKLLYKIAVCETDLSDVPGYLSRYEELLKYLIENGGISGGDFEYVLYTINQSLYTLYTTAEKPVKSAILKGQTLVNCLKPQSGNYSDYQISSTYNDLTLFKPNTLYTFINNWDKGGILAIRNNNGQITNVNFTKNSSILFTTPSAITNVEIYSVNMTHGGTQADCEKWKSSFIVIEGDYTNVDIPYFTGMQSVKMHVITTSNEDGTKTNILTVNEDVELRGIGEVKDELDLTTGELTQRIGEIILNGSEIWTKGINNSNDESSLFYTSSQNGKGGAGSVISNNFKSIDGYTIDYGTDGIYLDNSSDINIRISNSKLVSNNVNGFKTWLQSNPTTIQYKIATESIKTVDLTVVDQDNQPTKLGTFENLTHVLLEAENLIPEVEMEVATNLLEDTVFNLTNAFNTLYPTAAKPVVDGTLYGQTLVNLLNKLTVNAETGQTKNWYSGSYAMGTLKSGKYILLYNVKETSETNRNTPRIRLAGDKYLYHGYDNFNTTTGIKKWIFTANTDLLEFSYWVSGNTGKVVVEDFILLEYQEGMENWNIPYFTGVQSVKMPVLTTTGKNLWDNKNFVNGVIDGESIRVSAGDLYDTRFYYDFKENQQYVFALTSYSENKKLVYFKYNYTDGTDSGYTNFLSYSGETKSFISSANKTISYISFVHSDHDNYTLSNVQLEEGSVATPYEPYKSNILTTPADLELRKVGEVQDKLNVMTGEVTECIGEFILNGSEYWDIVNDTFRTGVINDKVIKLETQADRDKIVISCDRYPSRTYNDPWTTSSGNFISLTVGKVIVINDASFTTVEEWKEYLSQNPLTIKFVLATPTTKTVDLTVVNQDGNETKLRTFEDTTHVLLESEGLIPTASLTVRTKIPSASSTSLLMDDISTEQQQLESTVDEHSNNVDAIMMATTEIYEETL